MSNKTPMRFATRAIHAGQRPDPSTGAVMTPIFASSTFVQSAPAEHQGYDYSRADNPTRAPLEACLADLEGGAAGFAFASGMAATATLLETLDSGAHVIAMDDLYGGSNRLFRRVRQRSAGLEFSFVDLRDLDALAAAKKPNTRMIWVETPTNPLLRLVDLAAVAAFAREHDVLTVCDNTFCSPYLQRPLEHGFDVVMHSATKYLNGHSDVIAGALMVRDLPELNEQLKLLQMSIGGILGPFDSYLLLRGLKTLPLRMQAHCANAQAVAEHLEKHAKIEAVLYPGLESHPQHALAKRQMSGAGGMVSARIKGGMPAVRRLLKETRLFALAESLGGVESLINHPASMTHASLDEDTRARLGIDDGLLRLSVGIENRDDLLEELDRCLAAA